MSRPVTASRSAPPRLAGRGGRLWEQLHDKGRTYSPAHAVLIEEACRIADRLEQLDRILSGDVESLAQVVPGIDGTTLTLVVNSALSEARLQATALKSIVAELRQASATKTASPPADRPGTAVPATGEQGGRLAGIGDLTARIAKRRAEAAG